MFLILSIFIDTRIGKNTVCIVAFHRVEKNTFLEKRNTFFIGRRRNILRNWKTFLTLKKTLHEIEIGKNTADNGKKQQPLAEGRLHVVLG